MRAETCDRCGREAYTMTSGGTLVCRVHDPNPGMNYTCTAKSGDCDQPLHPNSDEYCVLHID